MNGYPFKAHFLQDHKRYCQGGGSRECWEKHYDELINNSLPCAHLEGEGWYLDL